MSFETKMLPVAPDAIAPDGSEVRLLPTLEGGGMAHFSLAPGKTARAVRHRTVEEIWYVLAGEGEMWRSDGREERIVRLAKDVSLTIPVGTSFQFRSTGVVPLEIVGVTMPPWPGPEEAELVEGAW